MYFIPREYACPLGGQISINIINIKYSFISTFYFIFHFRKSSQRTKDGGGEGGASASDKAQMAFKLYDRDKDGYITKAEMVKLSKNLTKDQVEKVHELNNLSDQNRTGDLLCKHVVMSSVQMWPFAIQRKEMYRCIQPSIFFFSGLLEV